MVPVTLVVWWKWCIHRDNRCPQWTNSNYGFDVEFKGVVQVPGAIGVGPGGLLRSSRCLVRRWRWVELRTGDPVR